jgi:hypothetical protein
VKRLVNGALLVEREASIDFCRNLSGNDLEDLLAKLNKEAVESSVNLIVHYLSVLLSVNNGSINKLAVFDLLRCGEDQGRVGCGILWLVFSDG